MSTESFESTPQNNESQQEIATAMKRLKGLEHLLGSGTHHHNKVDALQEMKSIKEDLLKKRLFQSEGDINKMMAETPESD